MHDLIIIGGGPAGTAAGVYAARKKMKTLLITESFGGQWMAAEEINNFIGFKSVSGINLAKKFREHLDGYPEIEIVENDAANSLEKIGDEFEIVTGQNKVLHSKTVLIASGSRRRRLNVPGEEKFEGRGVAYCAICDAPLFKDKAVAVVGGGNAGLGTAISLLPYVSKIYLLGYKERFSADPLLQEKIKNNDKIEIIIDALVTEIIGDDFVSGLIYEDRSSKVKSRLEIQGIFVEIGVLPNTHFIKKTVELNKDGEIIVDCRTQRTSQPGVWSAGDVSDCCYKQINIAIGDAAKAVLNIYEYLNLR